MLKKTNTKIVHITFWLIDINEVLLKYRVNAIIQLHNKYHTESTTNKYIANLMKQNWYLRK